MNMSIEPEMGIKEDKKGWSCELVIVKI